MGLTLNLVGYVAWRMFEPVLGKIGRVCGNLVSRKSPSSAITSFRTYAFASSQGYIFCYFVSLRSIDDDPSRQIAKGVVGCS